MNFKHKTQEWGGNVYLRVSKKRYENFIRYFCKLRKLEGDTFMGWHDSYDWSLDPDFDEKKANDDECWEHCNKCMVARCYFETYQPQLEYWLRVDYIKANNYDIDTIVKKPRKKRLTKKEKALADFLCKAFDACFELTAKER